MGNKDNKKKSAKISRVKKCRSLAIRSRWRINEPLREITNQENIQNTLQMIEEPAQYENVEIQNVLENTETKDVNIEGRRIVDILFFWQQIKDINHMPLFNCTIQNCEIIEEKRNGYISIFVIKCNMCGSMSTLKSDKTGERMDVNLSAVLGATSIGCGYSQLEELTCQLNIAPMSNLRYRKCQEDMEQIVEEVLMEQLKIAGEEETRIAIEQGKVDKEGYPCITVIADGAWSKRSYKTNYNALSGVAVIIGEATKKVLFLGVKNKFCMLCSRYSKNGETIPDHTCAKNWVGSSTAMEAAIIVEGFQKSIEMHGLKYLTLVGDGDSSVTKKLLEVKPYGPILVEKVECVNHLLRNFCHKLKDISKAPRSSSSQKIVPIKLRKVLESNILKFRIAIKKAAKYRSECDLSYAEKLSEFRKDVLNSIQHIFGMHTGCDQYFCTGFKNGEDNLIPQLDECGMKQDITNVLQRIVVNSSSFLNNKNNNAAELFNSLLNKFVGGKRINFSFRSSYKTRCQVAAISYNCREYYLEKISRHAGCSPGIHTRRFMKRRKLCRERNTTYRKKIGFRSKVRVCNPDRDYGAVDDVIPAEEINLRREKLIRLLRKTDDEIAQIERDTRGQSLNNLWRQERAYRITASNFGQICKRRASTKPDTLVKNLLYGRFAGNSATKYGQEHEADAIEAFQNLTGYTVRNCGLFIGRDGEYFLGASPDGILENEHSILEVKCPEKLKNMSVEQGISDKKN